MDTALRTLHTQTSKKNMRRRKATVEEKEEGESRSNASEIFANKK